MKINIFVVEDDDALFTALKERSRGLVLPGHETR